MDSSVTDPEASPRAVSLASEVVRIVRERRTRDPHLTWFEVVQGLVLARRALASEFRSPEVRARQLAFALVLAFLVTASAFLMLQR